MDLSFLFSFNWELSEIPRNDINISRLEKCEVFFGLGRSSFNLIKRDIGTEEKSYNHRSDKTKRQTLTNFLNRQLFKGIV